MRGRVGHEHRRSFRMQSRWYLVRVPSAVRPAAALGPRWEIVSDPQEFVIWEQAWRGAEGPSGVLLFDLLRCDSVRVLAAYAEDRIVAGAVLNSTPEVVGISNFFAAPDIASASWDGCVGFASALFLGTTLVGYQMGGASVRAPGFESAGPLRVWLHQE